MQKNIACLILAAGYSTRMKGDHKALLPLGKFPSMLEYLINAYEDAGIKNIYVALGHQEKEISKAIEHLNCKLVYNADYAKGMFSSVANGIMALDKNVEAIFLNPVDAALVQAKSILDLLTRREKNKQDNLDKSIIIPCFLEKCGHPPLLERKHFKPIIKAYHNQELNKNSGGLRGYFASLLKSKNQEDFLMGNFPKQINVDECIDFIQIPDAGVLSDIDDKEAYKKALEFLQRTNNRKDPDVSECFHIIYTADLPAMTKKHCIKIALGALRIGLALKGKNNHDFSLLNCICGGLLHDICRTQKKHAMVGGEYLRGLDYPVLAAIVASHTNLPSSVLERLGIFIQEQKLYTEEVGDLIDNVDYLYPAVCVYLADKFYSSDRHISLIQRHKLIRERYIDKPDALKAIDGREKVAKAVKNYFDKVSGEDAEIIVDKATGHFYELILLDLLEKYNLD